MLMKLTHVTMNYINLEGINYMFYIVWIVAAFAAVGAGCWLASVTDRKNKRSLNDTQH